MLKWMRREEGQSYVETALVLPFLILLVMGVLDIGRAFNAYIVVTNAAREGARYGIAHSGNADGIRARVLQETTGTGVTVDSADIAISYPDGQAPRNPIQVTVTHNFQIIASLVLGLDSVPVTATAEMEIIQ
jgi:Flp pilus assembly protein TadG